MLKKMARQPKVVSLALAKVPIKTRTKVAKKEAPIKTKKRTFLTKRKISNK